MNDTINMMIPVYPYVMRPGNIRNDVELPKYNDQLKLQTTYFLENIINQFPTCNIHVIDRYNLLDRGTFLGYYHSQVQYYEDAEWTNAVKDLAKTPYWSICAAEPRDITSFFCARDHTNELTGSIVDRPTIYYENNSDLLNSHVFATYVRKLHEYKLAQFVVFKYYKWFDPVPLHDATEEEKNET